MWELDYKESWAVKNWCFWTVVLEKTLRVPWTARRSNQSILKEINPEYSLEGLMLKLMCQYSGHQMQRTDSLERPWCWERLKAGGEGDDRGWDGWMASLTCWIWIWASSRSWWWIEAWCAAVHGATKSRTWLNDWTELNNKIIFNSIVFPTLKVNFPTLLRHRLHNCSTRRGGEWGGREERLMEFYRQCLGCFNSNSWKKNYDQPR